MLLRRELSKLSAQILAVARTQGAPQVQQRMVVEVAQAYTELNAIEEPEAPQQDEGEAWQGEEHAGNGAARELEDAEAGLEVDTVADGMAARYGEEPDDPPEEEADDETEEPKGSFARRFVARREARRSRKTGGSSLSDRLRGLVAERHET